MDLPLEAYEELRRLASIALKGERVNHTLQITALAHEAFIRLSHRRVISTDDPVQFRAQAAQAMRRILVDHSRARQRKKRGGGMPSISLTVADPGDEDLGYQVVEISDLLDKLLTVDERQARLVELRFFAGLTLSEVAGLLDISLRTASYEWRMARAWLLKELRGKDET